MRKCSSTILYAVCTFRPYKSTPVLKLFRTFTGRMTRGLSLRMVFSLLFQDTLFRVGSFFFILLASSSSYILRFEQPFFSDILITVSYNPWEGIQVYILY